MNERIAEVVPIGIPPRSVMWRRHQLAKSLLSHRELNKETAELIVAALDGEFEPNWGTPPPQAATAGDRGAL